MSSTRARNPISLKAAPFTASISRSGDHIDRAGDLDRGTACLTQIRARRLIPFLGQVVVLAQRARWVVGKLRLAAGTIVRLWRQIDDRVLIEKARRHELEAAGDAGLYRMIFGPWQMVQAEAVPHDNVAVRRWDDPWCPCRQAIVASRLVHEFAGGITLFGAERRHPKLMLDEPAPPSRGTVGIGEWADRRTRLQLVAGRLADPVRVSGLMIFQ